MGKFIFFSPRAAIYNNRPGLAAYEPDTKSTKALNRFPRRNRFISEYINQRTGEWRTAKQVSSRLQQLKESCKDDKSTFVAPGTRPL